jgi:hypothetical protein
MTDVREPVVSRWSLAAAVGLIALFLLILILFDRPAWCAEGIGIWSPNWSNCTSQRLFDPYTFSHVLHGVIFYWLLVPLAGKVSLRWRLVAALALEIGWEVIENTPWIIDYYRDNTATFNYAGDSVINSLGDVLVSIAGSAFASRISWQAAVALFVALELLALYLARDNLTLNIFMFLFPLEGLKQWQLWGA